MHDMMRDNLVVSTTCYHLYFNILSKKYKKRLLRYEGMKYEGMINSPPPPPPSSPFPQPVPPLETFLLSFSTYFSNRKKFVPTVGTFSIYEQPKQVRMGIWVRVIYYIYISVAYISKKHPTVYDDQAFVSCHWLL